mmetsp:Transcript_9597/g.30483  ORF Transcript_9597/g.30483 Transcript_9597/m.30483 type:complete len:226 (+) Transcript_9597:280-957(+)
MRSSCDTASRGSVSSLRSLIQRISQQAECRNSTSWDTTTEVCGYSANLCSSHPSAWKSKWLVGSSSSSSFGCSQSAFANSIFMRHPPESWLMGVARVGSEPWTSTPPCGRKPRATRMSAISRSAPSHLESSPSTSCNCLLTSAELRAPSASSRPASSCCRAACCVSNCALRVLAPSTSSTGPPADGAGRCWPTRKTSQEAGTGAWRSRRSRRSVLLPQPLGPTRP